MSEPTPIRPPRICARCRQPIRAEEQHPKTATHLFSEHCIGALGRELHEVAEKVARLHSLLVDRLT